MERRSLYAIDGGRRGRPAPGEASIEALTSAACCGSANRSATNSTMKRQPLADLSGARTGDGRQARARRRRPAPELAISERDRRALGEARLRSPLRDDVVVVFGIGGNFEQDHFALAPVADRLDPQRGAQFPMRGVVVEGVQDARALEKAEAARIHVAERGNLQGVATGDRAPQPFAGAGENLQSPDVVDGGAHVVGAPMIERAEDIGRRHRAEAEMIDRDARHQRQFGVDDRGFAGAQGEMKGSGQARRIEQRVNGQRVRGGARLFDPQRAEQREIPRPARRRCGSTGRAR